MADKIAGEAQRSGSRSAVLGLCGNEKNPKRKERKISRRLAPSRPSQIRPCPHPPRPPPATAGPRPRRTTAPRGRSSAIPSMVAEPHPLQADAPCGRGAAHARGDRPPTTGGPRPNAWPRPATALPRPRGKACKGRPHPADASRDGLPWSLPLPLGRLFRRLRLLRRRPIVTELVVRSWKVGTPSESSYEPPPVEQPENSPKSTTLQRRRRSVRRSVKSPVIRLRPHLVKRFRPGVLAKRKRGLLVSFVFPPTYRTAGVFHALKIERGLNSRLPLQFVALGEFRVSPIPHDPSRRLSSCREDLSRLRFLVRKSRSTSRREDPPRCLLRIIDPVSPAGIFQISLTATTKTSSLKVSSSHPVVYTPSFFTLGSGLVARTPWRFLQRSLPRFLPASTPTSSPNCSNLIAEGRDTGLGWDPLRKTIAASEDWWKERLKNGSVGDDTQNINESPQSTAAKENRTCKGKRKHSAKKAKSLTIDELVETSRIIGQCMQEPPRIQISSTSFTIPEAIPELESMSEVMDESQFDFYDYSTMLLKDKQNRETFMSICKERRLSGDTLPWKGDELADELTNDLAAREGGHR
ncbi:hypothetical protein KSP39_PZI001924 [Platanthera zijinensis]|uniref:Uncharacterized protein n=1 Tax=Platanthera zijinensis TaxID=2320716 RepID=A0AAP0BZJ6_9ASPA